MILENDERLEELGPNLKIIQREGLYRFSVDSILLADFVNVSNGESVIDLGTGSGVIPLLLTEKAQNLKIVGVEIQKELAEMAQKSINYNNKQREITIFNGDLKDAPIFLGKNKWDIVVTNPPYFAIGEGRISNNPNIAVARHEIKCTLEQIIISASQLMKDQGSFYMVHRYVRLKEIINISDNQGLFPEKLQPIASSRIKEPYLILVKFRKIPTELVQLPVKYLEEKQKGY